MIIKISYTEAKKRHPKLVEQVIAKLRKSKSKENKTTPSKLKWSYVWAETINQNTHRPTEKDRINCSSVSLQGSIGRWNGWADDPVWNGPKSKHAGFKNKPPGECPAEVKQVIVDAEKKWSDNQKRLNGMTQEQRNAEVSGILQQLSGKGFAIFTVPTQLPSSLPSLQSIMERIQQ